MAEYKEKIGKYDSLLKQMQSLLVHREEYTKTNRFLEQKLSETTKLLGKSEDNHKRDTADIKKLTDSLKLKEKALDFYKELSEKLEFRQTNELQDLNVSVRQMVENEKDYKQKIEILERENSEC